MVSSYNVISWSTTAIELVNISWSISSILLPLKIISPDQGEYKPDISFESVDLPLPVEPTIATF